MQNAAVALDAGLTKRPSHVSPVRNGPSDDGCIVRPDAAPRSGLLRGALSTMDLAASALRAKAERARATGRRRGARSRGLEAAITPASGLGVLSADRGHVHGGHARRCRPSRQPWGSLRRTFTSGEPIAASRSVAAGAMRYFRDGASRTPRASLASAGAKVGISGRKPPSSATPRWATSSELALTAPRAPRAIAIESRPPRARRDPALRTGRACGTPTRVEARRARRDRAAGARAG